jgi:hypothetical protein
VDAQWIAPGSRHRKSLVVLPFVPALLTPAIGDWWFWPSIAFGLGFNAFAGWRGLRMMRASSIVTDRRYDRDGKFQLSKEYHGTESATAASSKRRKAVGSLACDRPTDS